MEQANYIKAIVAAGLAFVTSLLGVMSVPVILLVASNVIDYATGLFACKRRKKKISSNIGILGIFKKVAMWLMVIVGMMVDEMLMYASSSIWKEWPFKFVVGCAVAIWLICNEIISILENIQDIGVNIPPFLKPIVKRIRSQVEEEMEELYVEEKGDEENED